MIIFLRLLFWEEGLLTNALNGIEGTLVSQNIIEFKTDISSYIIKNTASLMFMAPLIIIYVILQKYFLESVERTGLVG